MDMFCLETRKKKEDFTFVSKCNLINQAVNITKELDINNVKITINVGDSVT